MDRRSSLHEHPPMISQKSNYPTMIVVRYHMEESIRTSVWFREHDLGQARALHQLCFASKVQPRTSFGEPRSASHANKHATFRGQHRYLPSKSDPCRSNTLTFEIHVHTTQEGFWSWRRNAIPLLGPCQRSAIVAMDIYSKWTSLEVRGMLIHLLSHMLISAPSMSVGNSHSAWQVGCRALARNSTLALSWTCCILMTMNLVGKSSLAFLGHKTAH